MTKILTADIVDGLEEREIVVDSKTGIELVFEECVWLRDHFAFTTRDTVNIPPNCEAVGYEYSHFRRSSDNYSALTLYEIKECLRTGGYYIG